MAVSTSHAVSPAPTKTTLRDVLRRMSGPMLFMAPAVLLTAVFFFVPVFILFRISLTNMSTATGLKNYEMIGFENYATILKHPNTPVNLWTTVKYVVFTLCFFNVGMALVMALLSTHVPRRAGFVYRALWLLPRLTPSVVYIMMWKFIGADAPHGILNRHILGPLGIPPSNLISTEPFLFVVMTNGFIGASFGMIVFTSAIESIPGDATCGLSESVGWVSIMLPVVDGTLIVTGDWAGSGFDYAGLAGIQFRQTVFADSFESGTTCDWSYEVPMTGPPCARFSYIVNGLLVTFFNTSRGTAPLSFFWDFGDGTTSTLTDPQHLFVSPGSYSVSLTVMNALGMDSTTRLITVAP